MTLTKMIPAIIGLAVAGAIVGGWATNILQLSFRTDGTILSRYATVYPEIPNVDTQDAFFCNKEYATRWAGCNLK